MYKHRFCFAAVFLFHSHILFKNIRIKYHNYDGLNGYVMAWMCANMRHARQLFPIEFIIVNGIIYSIAVKTTCATRFVCLFIHFQVVFRSLSRSLARCSKQKFWLKTFSIGWRVVRASSGIASVTHLASVNEKVCPFPGFNVIRFKCHWFFLCLFIGPKFSKEIIRTERQHDVSA